MTDANKLIKAIAHCYTPGCSCEDCPYSEQKECHDGLLKDAHDALVEQQEELSQMKAALEESALRLEDMLKKKETARPRPLAVDQGKGWYRFVCGVCGMSIYLNDHYCRHCGRGVKWE